MAQAHSLGTCLARARAHHVVGPGSWGRLGCGLRRCSPSCALELGGLLLEPLGKSVDQLTSTCRSEVRVC